MINRFSQFLVEEEKTVYFTFGRMNPPTIGHGKLLDKLAQKAGKNPYRVYVSQSQDKNKNPLQYKEKVKHVRKMFPKHARSVMVNNKVKTAIDVAVALYDEGFRNLVMVVGSDRIREFDVLLNKYNGKEARHGFYNFNKINVISAGERDPDAEGIEGMSASKQRDNAKQNDFTSFAQGLPKAMSNPDAKRLFNAVRKGMGLKEATEFKNHVQLKPVSDLREAYLRDNIFEEGEQVVMTKHGIVGNIKYLGTNYLIVESKGETWRCWLDDVSKVDPNFEPTWDVQDIPTDDVDGVVRESLNEAQKWKKGGPDGEVHTQHKGTTWRVRKDYNHNDRHTGEYRIEYKKKNPYGGHDWEWHDTVQGKEHAKSRLPEGTMGTKPEWGTPESTKKAKDMTPGEKNEGLWANIRAKRARGEKMRKKGEKGAPTPDQIKRAQEATTPQDKDIADRKGTQPARYHKGLSKATKIARDRQFKKQTKMADDDPAAYKPAPGDKTAKTKPSKHTTFVRKMMGEQDSHTDQAKAKIDREKEMDKKKHDRMMDKARMRDTKVANMNEYGGPKISRKDYLKQKPMQEASFADKSKASGISVGTLKKVYQRGVAAWKTGHRPGTTPSQWGHARVNAFIRKKKQGGLNHDKDLA